MIDSENRSQDGSYFFNMKTLIQAVLQFRTMDIIQSYFVSLMISSHQCISTRINII